MKFLRDKPFYQPQLQFFASWFHQSLPLFSIFSITVEVTMCSYGFSASVRARAMMNGHFVFSRICWIDCKDGFDA